MAKKKNQWKGFNTDWLGDRGLATINLAILEQQGPRAQSEQELQKILLLWIRTKYPEAYQWTHVDLSGVRLGFRAQAMIAANQCTPGFPDITIYLPRGRHCGLALELKREGERPIKKDGTPSADKHVQEQALWISQLTACGFSAQFAVGFENATKAITDYLEGRAGAQPEERPDSDRDGTGPVAG